ncbi:hypothetical protein [Natrinema sp. 1APR25-10V2]|uniref:hypothetical protein n=1 Tax=Natrinema sp. 1APR25-10V2 TaxID=2951081 RepID=UPI002874BB60|nr:hypothetical protein [Natrinema sp. 1APR25-10V2]MDS0476198.1 hypothetical protein [Natrinema sp. 1APR25-10V2]
MKQTQKYAAEQRTDDGQSYPEQAQKRAAEQRTDDGQSYPEFYMPAMPRPSSEPGRVERALRTLFRRRGGYRVVVRNEK